MSIQKKSLISTLKTAKKANVAASAHEGDVKGEKIASMRQSTAKTLHAKNTLSGKGFGTLKLSYKNFKSAKAVGN